MKRNRLTEFATYQRRWWVFVLVLLPVILAADEIRVVFPNQPQRREALRTFFRGNVEYLNGRELAAVFSVNTYVNDEVNKLVLHFRDGEVKITAFSSFVVVDERTFQLPLPT